MRIKKILYSEDGAITVWITLILIGMLAFVLIVIECVRYDLSKSVCKQAGNMAVYSAMADYEPDIYDNYNIYALDVSYGGNFIDKSELERNIRKYANSSLCNNINNLPNIYKNIIGCETKKIELSKWLYMKDHNEYFVNQMCALIKEKLDDEDLAELSNISKSKIKKKLVCKYILEYCSSYKSTYVLGYMKREYMYEVEYILKGKNSDNKNIQQVYKELEKKYIDEESKEILCTQEEYNEILMEKLMSKHIDVLVNRFKKIMLSNINKTFDKNLSEEKLVLGVDVLINFNIEERLSFVKMITDMISVNNINKPFLIKFFY